MLLMAGCSGMLLMAGCSNPLDLLTGGGVNTAANVQAGKTNTQTIGTTTVTEQKLVRPQARKIQQTADNNKVRAESVKTVVVNEYPVWLIIAFAVALFMDSPVRWVEQILGLLRRKK
jgi:hypothetical protein